MIHGQMTWFERRMFVTIVSKKSNFLFCSGSSVSIIADSQAIHFCLFNADNFSEVNNKIFISDLSILLHITWSCLTNK